MRIEKDLVAASAAPLVLGILVEGETYGYQMLRRVDELSDGEIAWTDAMLYPLLYRLERLGHVRAEWRETSGRRRKYYAITPSGRTVLADRRRQWRAVSGALDRLWQQASDSRHGGAAERVAW